MRARRSRARGEVLRAQLAHAECRGLLVADYALPQVLSVLSQLPDMRVVYVLHTGEEGALEATCGRWDCLNTCLEGPDVRLPHIAGEANQTLEIMYTSGTTGSPRGCCSTTGACWSSEPWAS